MKTKICSFADHANISQKEETKLKVKNEIINLIENKGAFQKFSYFLNFAIYYFLVSYF